MAHSDMGGRHYGAYTEMGIVTSLNDGWNPLVLLRSESTAMVTKRLADYNPVVGHHVWVLVTNKRIILGQVV